VQRILIVYGTRPEAIKLAPVLRALERRPNQCAVTLCATAQHRELTDQAQRLFDLTPDFDLNLMEAGQDLNHLTARAFAALDDVIVRARPDWVIVQGDTTSAMVAALAAFHRGVRVGHVEAGLRTGDLARPFPEEMNRRVADLVAAAHFAPTARAEAALLGEGVAPDRIFLTGNTVVDALQAVAARLGPTETPRASEVLVTVHRRESFGPAMRGIFEAIADLARAYPSVRWIFPVHPNPAVEAPARSILSGAANVSLVAPLDYADFVAHLRRCRLVLTDSGGIQEEAPTFGTPVLVLRETTERPEGVWAGVARLIGVDRRRIVADTAALLDDPDALAGMAVAGNPYGDGLASDRIASILTGQPWTPFDFVAREKDGRLAPTLR
jgi:UDP-N-acetylglucosamine 2-epimerase (non-hydrolysing)